MLEAIDEVMARSQPATVATAGLRSEQPSATGLTAREQDVAALIARGLTNRQIGEALVITEGTVASHVVHILDKLNFSSRAQVAVWAAEHRVQTGVVT